jgi:hypothetical protein
MVLAKECLNFSTTYFCKGRFTISQIRDEGLDIELQEKRAKDKGPTQNLRLSDRGASTLGKKSRT